MDGDNTACGAFNELRGAVRKRSKGIGGLGHGKFSGDVCMAETWHWPKRAATGRMGRSQRSRIR
jgi:hypothetical protein